MANITPSHSNELEPGSAARDAAKWLDGLRQQQTLFQKLAELSAEQSKHIEQEDMDALNHVLGQRQQLIAQLQQVATRYAGFVAQVNRDTLPVAQREAIEQQMTSIDELRAGIEEMDYRAQRRLLAAHKSLGGELKQLSTSGVARNAYAGQYQAAAQSASRFTDQRG